MSGIDHVHNIVFKLDSEPHTPSRDVMVWTVKRCIRREMSFTSPVILYYPYPTLLICIR